MQVAEYDDPRHRIRYDVRSTPAEILAHSSNIGTAQDRQSRSVAPGSTARSAAFGFGAAHRAFRLPGETAGILRHYRRWYEMDAATISFGQGMSASRRCSSPTAMGALANGGTLMEPIARASRRRRATARSVEESAPDACVARSCRADTARLVADMLTGGHRPRRHGRRGRDRRLPRRGQDGHRAEGRTSSRGGYADELVDIASFVGFVPARRAAPRDRGGRSTSR